MIVNQGVKRMETRCVARYAKDERLTAERLSSILTPKPQEVCRVLCAGVVASISRVFPFPYIVAAISVSRVTRSRQGFR